MKKRRPRWVTILVTVGIVFVLFLTLILVDGYSLNEDLTKECTNTRTSDKVLSDWLVNDKGFDLDGFRAKYKIEEIKITGSK